MYDVEKIMRRVEGHFSLPRGAMLDKDKHKTISLARSILIYLCKTCTVLSLAEIADALHRDTSTIQFNFKKVNKNPKLKSLADKIGENLL